MSKHRAIFIIVAPLIFLGCFDKNLSDEEKYKEKCVDKNSIIKGYEKTFMTLFMGDSSIIDSFSKQMCECFSSEIYTKVSLKSRKNMYETIELENFTGLIDKSNKEDSKIYKDGMVKCFAGFAKEKNSTDRATKTDATIKEGNSTK